MTCSLASQLTQIERVFLPRYQVRYLKCHCLCFNLHGWFVVSVKLQHHHNSPHLLLIDQYESPHSRPSADWICPRARVFADGLCGRSCACVCVGSGPISWEDVFSACVYRAAHVLTRLLAGTWRKRPCREKLLPFAQRVSRYTPSVAHVAVVDLINGALWTLAPRVRNELQSRWIKKGADRLKLRSVLVRSPSARSPHWYLAKWIGHWIGKSVCGAGPPRNTPHKCDLVGEKVLSPHEIEVRLWCQTQLALSPCQTICVDQRESRSSICSTFIHL